MLSEAAMARVGETESNSYVCDLKKWHGIMQAYENGGHAYHATMPTDALAVFRDTLIETQEYGFEKVRDEQIALGSPSANRKKAVISGQLQLKLFKRQVW